MTAIEQTKRVLWIDDMVDETDPLVTLLRTTGLHVAIATLGLQGVEKAQAQTFELILLDLHLPDAWGISLLERLRQQTPIPVLILTGVGDVDDAVAALRLGAVDFLRKPIIDEEQFLGAVWAAVDGQPPRQQYLERRTREPELLRQVLLVFARSAPTTEVHTPPARAVLVDTLVSLLGAPDIGPLTFGRCGHALRRISSVSSETVSAEDFAVCQALIAATIEFRKTPFPQTVNRAVAYLEEAARRGARVSEAEVAMQLSVDRSHVGDLLRRHTGFTFRELRWTVFAQQAVCQLTQSDRQIAQIAYRLGYDHPGQLDRDFLHVLGVTPRVFRKAWASCRS